jgi:arylsulfatase A-like enzyme
VRGVLTGALAGASWWAVEQTVDWLAGGVVPNAALLALAAADVAVGAVVGLVVGTLAPRAGWRARALALAMGFGFCRVYEPPGFGAEALFLVAAPAAVALGVLIAGGDDGPLAFAHVVLLTASAAALSALALEEAHAEALRGLLLPALLLGLPLAAVALDRVTAVALPQRVRRLGIQVVAAAVAAFVWGHPLGTAPLDDAVVTAVPPPAGTPDVILVSLDTTRADHLSTYGYARETSPNLTALAASSLTFTEARSTASWTLPGHASMFTGMYPSRHGAHLAGGWLPGQGIDGHRRVAFPLPDERVTLAEALRDRGYQTGAFVANFSYLYRDFGLAQGFDRYDDAPGLLLRVQPYALHFVQRFAPGFLLKPFRSAPQINAAALSWLDDAAPGRPVFLFLNYMEAHQPWLAPPPFDRWARGLPDAQRLATSNLYTHAVRHVDASEQAFVAANYDGQLAAMDQALGALLDALRARGRFEQALVVVTADHGEFLGEHDQVGHIARMLYEPVLHVPLVVKPPGAAQPPARIDRPVQLVDVLPTVLQTVGAPIPPGVQGQPLLDADHALLAEEDINPFLVARYGALYDRAIRVLYEPPYKLITTSRGQRMLFDLTRDPGESQDLSATEPAVLDRMAQRLEASMSTMVAAAPGRQVN